MGSTLERHPFSGLIHSAGELLHRESGNCHLQLLESTKSKLRIPSKSVLTEAFSINNTKLRAARGKTLKL